jgi:hypothetical protein
VPDETEKAADETTRSGPEWTGKTGHHEDLLLGMVWT